MTHHDSRNSVQPLSEFYEDLKRAEHEQFRSRTTTRVRSGPAFDEQKAHILALYDGVTAARSFVDAGGQIFDCVPFAQQPALRSTQLAAPPQPPTPPAPPGLPLRPPDSAQIGRLDPAQVDRHGMSMSCPPGTVPIRRVTLDELTRFETLDHYLRKHGQPRNRGRRFGNPLRPEVESTPHEYAHASQSVKNIGGHGFLNVWDPAVVSPQTFSLSQQWYVAQGAAGVQTVEVGWQVYPEHYGHSKPVLFTYWTADGYATTGSYGTSAGDFVQVSADFPVGMALETWSEPGGAQVEIELTVMLQSGKWWIFVNGTDASHAIGYYPAELYQGGPLATAATDIDFGGETVGSGNYPPMGSGTFAATGYKSAAYQRNIYYIAPNNTGTYASLVPSQDWPDSYTIAVGTSSDWGEYFYFGGPGGAGTAPRQPEDSRVTRAERLVLYGPGVRLEGLSVSDAAAVLRRLVQA
jgi:hypothetical protein